MRLRKCLVLLRLELGLFVACCLLYFQLPDMVLVFRLQIRCLLNFIEMSFSIKVCNFKKFKVNDVQEKLRFYEVGVSE